MRRLKRLMQAGEVKRLGITEFSFPTLVASGYRAAFPHGWTSPKEIVKGDVAVVDVGPMLDSYGGCVCRTFKTTGGWEIEIEVVREAIHKALEIIESVENPSVRKLKVARETVRKNGYESWT